MVKNEAISTASTDPKMRGDLFLNDFHHDNNEYYYECRHVMDDCGNHLS